MLTSPIGGAVVPIVAGRLPSASRGWGNISSLLRANKGSMLQLLQGDKPALRIRKDISAKVHGKVILEIMSEAD